MHYHVKKKLCTNAKQLIEKLVESGIYFPSKEILVNNKTTRWNANNYVCTAKYILWLFQILDMILKAKPLRQNNMKDCNLIMCDHYLLLQN